MDVSTESELTNDSHQAVDDSSSSPSTGDAPQMTEHLDEPPTKREIHTRLPQEILDKIWDAALKPWVNKRVIILDYNDNAEYSSRGILRPRRFTGTFECANPINAETSKLPGNVRLVNSKARSTVELFSGLVARNMFPERPDLSRKHLGRSFRAQHADFQHDIFWLSRGFLDARMHYILLRMNRWQITLDLPQPSHMMLSLRHMVASMEMAYTGDTPCLGRQQRTQVGYGPLDGFCRIVQIRNSERLRTLTVLLPRDMDEWNGKVDYEALEHRPFGTSIDEKASVLELAKNQSNRSHIEQIYVYWSGLISLAVNRDYDLPSLQFSRRRSQAEGGRSV